MRACFERALAAVAVIGLVACGGAEAEQPPVPPPPPVAPPPQPAAVTTPPPVATTTITAATLDGGAPLPPLPSQAPRYAAAPSDQEPPRAQWVQSYAEGQWVYTPDYGWLWVPAGATTSEAEGVPNAYLYTPSWGWTWYVSPWGWGPYHYGVWVRRPWHPVGWRGPWVAHPRVVVHLGGGHPGAHPHTRR